MPENQEIKTRGEEKTSLSLPDEGVGADSRRFWTWAAALLFAVYLFLALADLFEPWPFHHQGWNGARRSIQAKNYLEFGYLKTGLKPLDNLGHIEGVDGLPVPPYVYWHHPPGPMIYLSLLFKLAGYGEAQARLGFILLAGLTFWLLWGAFWRAGGKKTAFFILLGYTFAPISATYLNFVNFEPLVLFAMACILYGFERFREANGRKWFFVILFGLFAGIFSDYPILPFSFFAFLLFWFVLRKKKGDAPQPDGPASRRFLRAYAVAALLLTVLMVLLLASYRNSAGAFADLADARFHGRAFATILNRWGFYTGFFTPALFAAVLIYFVDFLPRAADRQLNRLDGYFAIYLATAVSYAIVLRGVLMHHEYGALYFVPPIAIASGVGLMQFVRMASRGKPWMENLLLGSFVFFLILFALPKIHSKHCLPAYEFTEPIYGKKADDPGDLFRSLPSAGAVVKELAPPDERVLLTRIGHHPAMKYYLDREYDFVDDEGDLKTIFKEERLATYWVRLFRPPYPALIPVFQARPHIRYGRYAVVDLSGKKLAHTEVRVPVVREHSFLGSYLGIGSDPIAALAVDHWRSFDYALKLDRPDDADYHRQKALGQAPLDPLYQALAIYNSARSRGTKAKLSEVRDHLLLPDKTLRFNNGMELVGYRLLIQADGKTRLTMVFRAEGPLTQNADISWEARPATSRPILREIMEVSGGEWPFDVPTTLWKPKWLYAVEFDLDVPYERYELSIGLTSTDSIKPEKPPAVNPLGPGRIRLTTDFLGTIYPLHDLILIDAEGG